MEEESSKDQASQLRDLVEEMDENTDSGEEMKDHFEQEEVNVLNLPPRKEVHQSKKTRIKWKLSLPLIRLLVILFLLIVAVIASFQLWGDQLFNLDDGQGFDNILPGWEQINIKRHEK
ncbi:hypothetical protein [Virgibacillus senegalensis]|uniref:hypothetical protein n=1 Tax=Virgibacillus senegalensis TaxID=1499679 RepID=UPI00069EABE0|nr:hypothetical protein [Virgibacillus senegalensis]